MIRSTLLLAGILAVVVAPPPASAGRAYAPAVREMTERRTMHARHWLLADGTYRAEFCMRPIHYQAPDGDWQPIDTHLVTTARTGFALANETNTLKAFLPDKATGWVRVESAEGSVAFRTLDVADGAASVGADSVQFDGVGDGMSLSYTVEPGRVKELITLNKPAAAPVFRQELKLHGLVARKNPNNSVTLADGTGKAAMHIAAPWMQDSTGKRSGAIAVNLTASADGLVYEMTSDPEWLADAQYPVIIDPVITRSKNWTAVNILDESWPYPAGSLDAYWEPGLADDNGWPPSYPPYSGNGDYLAVGIEDYTKPGHRSILSFADLPKHASRILSAELKLWSEFSTGSPNMQVGICSIDKYLDDDGPLYPTPNTIGITAQDLSNYPSVVAPLEPGFWGFYKTFDVTDLVQDWVVNRLNLSFSLMIRDMQEDIDPYQRNSKIVYFEAAESTLEVVYTDSAHYVSPSGNNNNPGTAGRPWGTIAYAMQQLYPGDTLLVKGGEYTRIVEPTLRAGTETDRITVRAYPGESPTLKGLLRLNKPDYWTFSGLNVTWPYTPEQDDTYRNEHMVKIHGGTGWVYQNAEIWGARSLAGLLVGFTAETGPPSDWVVRYNTIHDTADVHSGLQDGYLDHLLYVNTGVTAGPGLVERNILFNASNGEGIKLAGSSVNLPNEGAANVTVRYNTVYNTVQAILVGWYSHHNTIEWNLLSEVRDDKDPIRVYGLFGQGNTAYSNYGYGGYDAMVWTNPSGTATLDEDDNIWGNVPDEDDPLFVSTVPPYDFHPQKEAAQPYGRYGGIE